MNTASIVAPSILSGDFCDIGGALDRIRRSRADWVHMDVMDGHFVPQITFGPKMVADARGRTDLPLDVHLMVSEPERHIPQFLDAGADLLTFHQEAAVHSHRLLQTIRARGVKAGISIVPATAVTTIEHLLPEIDLVLVMTVNPGFGGQSLIGEALTKVRRLAAMRADRGLEFRISVDGGINESTASTALGSGADVLVTGSAFFRARDPEHYVEQLRRPEGRTV
jgi:ribulose-phosphate 3-epimerase